MFRPKSFYLVTWLQPCYNMLQHVKITLQHIFPSDNNVSAQMSLPRNKQPGYHISQS